MNSKVHRSKVDVFAGVKPGTTIHILVVLLEPCSLFAVGLLLDILRLTNREAGKEEFSWEIRASSEASEGHTSVSAIDLEVPIENPTRTIVLLCGDATECRTPDRRLLSFVRRVSRVSLGVGAIGMAIETLAQAGVLNGRQVPVHFSIREALSEKYHEVEFSDERFRIQPGLFLCAGGMATVEFSLQLVRLKGLEEISRRVNELVNHIDENRQSTCQRLPAGARYGVRNEKLLNAIQAMEDSVDEKINMSELARSADVSTRQLERLFARYIGETPKRFAKRIRLERARTLLLNTEMSVGEIAITCGFATPSHFCKSYRLAHGVVPSKNRTKSVSRSSSDDDRFTQTMQRDLVHKSAVR